jgi:hypothetical protein
MTKIVPMGAIVIRTRYDEGRESAEVPTSDWLTGTRFKSESSSSPYLRIRQEPVHVDRHNVGWFRTFIKDQYFFKTNSSIVAILELIRGVQDILDADPDIYIKGWWWCRIIRIATQFVLRKIKKYRQCRNFLFIMSCHFRFELPLGIQRRIYHCA